jgi:hypothetical protein
LEYPSLAVLFGFFPRVIANPIVLLFGWIASALLYQGWRLHRDRRKRKAVSLGAALRWSMSHTKSNK